MLKQFLLIVTQIIITFVCCKKLGQREAKGGTDLSQ